MIYPGSLPLPQLANYELNPQNSILSTGLSTGLTIRRQFAPSAPWTQTLTWIAEPSVIESIQAWLISTDYNWFDMPTLTPNEGSSAVPNQEVRLMARPGTIRSLGPVYELSIMVELRAISTISEEAVLAAAEYTVSEIESADDLAAALSTYLDTYPVENAC